MLAAMRQATEPNLAPFPGTDRFAIGRELGSGGMGIVFEAEDKVRPSRVALKTLHRMNPTDLYRFKKEFRSLQSLIHPNLVTLYEFFSEGGRWFFTMELVEGTDFLSYVRGAASDAGRSGCFTLPRRQGRQTMTAVDGNQPAIEAAGFFDLSEPSIARTRSESIKPAGQSAESPAASTGPEEDSPAEAASETTTGQPAAGAACDLDRLRAVMEQIAGGIHYLHESGMLHRDLKPSNVLVTPDGSVKILDFGLITEVEGRFPLARWDAENIPGATFAALGAAGLRKRIRA